MSEEAQTQEQVRDTTGAEEQVEELPEAQVEEIEEEPEEESRETEDAEERSTMTFKELQPGMVRKGKVMSVTDFGAFVDIGVGVDGLVHVSKLASGYVEKPEDVVAPGDEVTVWVKNVDRKRKRISLSMVDPTDRKKSWKDLQAGDVVDGRVVRLTNFGAFVDVGVGIDGLVHISELAEGYVNKVEDVVSVGDAIEVKILDVDRDRKRISLSIRELSAQEYAEPEEEQEDTPTNMEWAFRQAREQAGGEEGPATEPEHTNGTSDASDKDATVPQPLKQ